MKKVISVSAILICLVVPLCIAQTSKAMDGFDSVTRANDTTRVEDPVEAEKEKLEKNEVTYQIEALALRKEVFRWNHLSSMIIFWMVVIIVFLGLVFSAIQFYISMMVAKKRAGAEPTSKPEGEDKPESTGLKISMSGVEVNSSVLGIIILVIALAFLYLYLIYVYPVKEFNVDEHFEPKLPSSESVK